MDRQETDNHQLVERYLQGRLTPDEERLFEEAYLADADLLDELLVAEKLRQGLRRHGAVPAAPARRRPFWQSIPSSARYAAAASVLLAVAVLATGTLYLENRGLREQLVHSPQPAVTRLHPLVTVRGDGFNELAQPGAEEWTVLLVDAGFSDYDEYIATLVRLHADTREAVREFQDLAFTDDDRLAVGMPGSVLRPGDYELLIGGRMRDWPADRAADAITSTPLRIIIER